MRIRPTLIVLAAGSGSRFGGPLHKLAQPFDGLTVLGTTLMNALGTGLPVLAVTTSELAPLAARQLAERDIVVLDAPAGQRGMGSSIACGVGERAASPGWLVMPADMPLVRPESMLAVASALDQHPVVVAQHHGRRGHPVAFAAELYPELVQLDGDEGARRVVARYPAHGLELPDPGVLLDIDTAADLEALRRAAADPCAAAPVSIAGKPTG